MTGAPSQSIHHHPDDQALDVPNDLPPPSYEAARAAGAAPPPRPGQLPPTTIANPQTPAPAHDPAAASSSTPPYASSPRSAQGAESTAAWGVAGDNAIALQPLAQPPMSTNGHHAQQQQTAPDATGRPSNGVPKVVPLHLMEEKSEWVDCQFCKKRTQTRIVKKGKGFQCLTGAAFCVVCVCLTPLPCCLHWFEQTQWFCTSCEKQIAVRVRDGEIRVFPTPEEALVPSQYATVPDVQQTPAVLGGEVLQQQQQEQPQQQVGTVPGPVMTPSPPRHQSPTLAPPEHSPVLTPPPQVQYDPIPSPPALEQRPATPRIQVETAPPIPASQGPEPSSHLPDGPRQPLAGAEAEQGQQLAAVVSEGDRAPGAPPLKF